MRILLIHGGIGKNIAATAVVRSLHKRSGEKPVIITGWPDVWHANPHVERVWQMGRMAHFYDAYYSNGNPSELVQVEPYRHPDYVAKRRHLIDVWCEQLGIEWDGQPPELLPGRSDEQVVQQYLKRFKKPVLVFQPFGGPGAKPPGTKPQMQRRDLFPATAEELAKRLSEEFAVLHAKAPKQPEIPGTSPLADRLGVVLAAIRQADAVLAIDSFVQHAAAAFGKRAVVLWRGTSPTCLGYSLHGNLEPAHPCPTPFCHRPNSFLFDQAPGGGPWQCPYNEQCAEVDVDRVVKETLNGGSRNPRGSGDGRAGGGEGQEALAAASTHGAGSAQANQEPGGPTRQGGAGCRPR